MRGAMGLIVGGIMFAILFNAMTNGKAECELNHSHATCMENDR